MRFISILLLAVILMGGTIVAPVYAATSPSLGTAATYSILAGSEVTNTGATTISGDVGISPGIGGSPHYSGFGTVTLGGTIHDADGAALTAQDDKNTAYTALASQTCTTDYGAVTKELAGETLVPGVYCANSFHLSSGTLTLNGSSSGVWIFKSASDLIITGSSADVVFTGGGLACNVWWRVVSTATLDAGSSFIGNILADTSITLAAGASLNGRALARTAAVTLSSNSITAPACTASTSTSSSSSDEDDDEDDEDEADIQVTKKANPTALLSGPGSVTYTYKVTNEGDVSLRHVSVKDDKCSPVQFVSGDSNNNERLGLDEVWIYTCTKKVSQTETNKATARGAGSENGEYVHDTDIATVVVAPRLPGAGFASDKISTPGHMLSYIFALPSFLLKLIR